MAPGNEPGWYPDPDDASRVRWWDGSDWTDRTGERQTPPAAAPATEPSGGSPKPPMYRRPLLYIALLAFAGAFAAAFVLLSGSEEAGAEVILEPTASAGTDPFTDSVATEQIELAGGEVTQVSGGDASVESVDGSAPGLYGGTGEKAVCDAEQMIAFLEENPDKAAAFAEAVGVSTDELSDYIASLTPVLLREDTRVTNHGFMSGTANPFQAVLQAGTAVMVDDRGVPRVRCECGNPLAEPAAAAEAPEFSGERWESFDEGRLVAVSESAERLESFELVDVNTGESYEQAVGSGGLTVDELLNLRMPAFVDALGNELASEAQWVDGVHPDANAGAEANGATVVGIGLEGERIEGQEVLAAVGDVTGDGVDDGVVVRQWMSCGASCTESFDVVVFESSGEVLEALPVDLGSVESLRLVDGGFELEGATYAEGDSGASGPTLETSLRFEWNGSEFERVE